MKRGTKTQLVGLSSQEAKERLKQYGLNELAGKRKLSGFLKFISYFKDPLIILLIISAIISGITGEFKSMAVILIMVFLSVILNFYQEHKSNQAAEKIAKKLATKALVIRDGQTQEIITKYLVPGDIIALSAGDIIPADADLIEADDFYVNESVLTGESFPAEKNPQDKKGKMIFSGTNVVSGFAKAIITKTGINSEYGKIASELRSTETPNAFELGIKSFGLLIIKIITFIVIIIFIINTLYHKDIIDSLIFAIAVAVGVTPELLPMIMSVNMARGSIKMAKKGVIVKRLNAIPDFGSMDILCTDKTGTLTQDKITVVKYLSTKGESDELVLRLAYLNGAFETGIKSLLDKAILDFKKINIKEAKKIAEIPYDFNRRRSSIVCLDQNKKWLITKGAPEEVFKICQMKNQKAANDLYQSLSREGFRVLAIAAKTVTQSKQKYTIGDEKGLTLYGFIAFYDPLKKSASETIRFMKEHGIEIKILTGDSPLVAEKICQDLQIPITGIISGDELDIDNLSHQEIAIKARKNNIFARISPMQKEKIIETLKNDGSVVGYMGDGINDAPSLKIADVGISVDNAVDVAKETADIILMTKGLEELMEGVLEGRKTFGNTMKYLMMGLSSNFGNMFSLIGASLFLPFFPMLPGQILFNNLLYDTSQLAIPSDQVDQDYLRKPKHWDMGFIKRFMWVFGPISSVFDLITFYVLFAIFGLKDSLFQTGWFIESLATQVLVIYIIRTRKLPFIQSWPSKYLIMATLAIIAIGWSIALGPIGQVFDFSPLPLKVIGSIILIVLSYLMVTEIVKRFFYSRICRGDRI